MPKGCTCRVVVDLWCRVHHPDNRARIRLSCSGLVAKYWSADRWLRIRPIPDLQADMTTFHAIARKKARASQPDAYAAWERRQKARQ